MKEKRNKSKMQELKNILDKKIEKKSGITLITLIITIIIIIILSTVTISVVLGESGIIVQTQKVSELAENSRIAEEENLQELLDIYENAMEGTGETTNDGDDGEEEEETIETTTSYCSTSAESYYADVDGDGTVDGIIFADLAIGGSGTWNDNSYSSYSYDAVDSSSLKEYTISEDTYTDDNFGEGYIITPVSGTTGEDRFYVMALEDVDSSYYWYYNAYGSLPSSKVVSYSTNDFGEGQSNTEFWLEAYANETYGSAYTSGSYTDLWSLTDVVGTNVGDSDSIWFVPSKSEWSAFGDVFEITYSTSYDITDCWTSSVYNSYYVYATYAGEFTRVDGTDPYITVVDCGALPYEDIGYNWGVGESAGNVRLATTF